MKGSENRGGHDICTVLSSSGLHGEQISWFLKPDGRYVTDFIYTSEIPFIR